VRVQTACLQEIPPAGVVWRGIVNTVRSGITRKEGDQVVVHDFPQSGHEGIHGSIAGDTGRIGQQLLAPDKARVLAEVDHMLEEAAKDIETEALPDASEPGGIGQRLVQAVAEIPPDTEAIRGQGEELALRAKALEEHHEVELEEDHGIDRRPASVGIAALDPIPDETQIEAGIEVAVEVIAGHEGVERNSDGWTKLSGLSRTKHRRTPQS
jgi:hypothetical protein